MSWNKNLTRKNGYPSLRVDKHGATLVDCFYGAWEDVFSFDVPLGARHHERENFALDSYSIKRNESGTIGEIELVFVPAGAENIPTNSNAPDPTCRVSLFESPLEMHPKYRTKWNYCLAARDDAPDTSPSWWGEKTDLSTSDDEVYRWIKTPSELPQQPDHTWKIVKQKTKPGQESFFMPSVVVEEKLYFSDVKKASKACENAGKIMTPKNTFGRKNGSWLNMGADIFREGKKWVVSTTYQFSGEKTAGANDGWDTELYS